MRRRVTGTGRRSCVRREMQPRTSIGRGGGYNINDVPSRAREY